MKISNPPAGGLTLKSFGSHDSIKDSNAVATTWTDIDLSAVVGAKQVLAILKVIATAGQWGAMRQNGDTDSHESGDGENNAGGIAYGGTHASIIIVATDGNGVIEYYHSAATNLKVELIGWIE